MAERGRTEGYPRLTARKNWGKYALGMGTEALFIGGLTLIGLAIAIVAVAVYR